MKIIRKASINKKTKQLSITVPKKLFKTRFPKIKIDKNMEFEIRLANRRRKNG